MDQSHRKSRPLSESKKGEDDIHVQQSRDEFVISARDIIFKPFLLEGDKTYQDSVINSQAYSNEDHGY